MMEAWQAILTFLTGAATIVISQSVQAWREASLDKERRADDRRIDRGRTEARTLADLQKALYDLRLAVGSLHAAMRAGPAPEAELEAYARAKADVRLHAARTLSDSVSDSADQAVLLAGIVASTEDESGRIALLPDFFSAVTAAEEAIKPTLRKLIEDGYLKLE